MSQEAKPLLGKYELSAQVVNYLRNAVNSQQIRGANAASDLLNVLAILDNPANKKELVAEEEKRQKESQAKEKN